MMLAVALGLILQSQPAADGNALLALCKDYGGGDPSDAAAVACVSYVAGFADAVTNYETMLEVTRGLEMLAHTSMLARMGALPKERMEQLTRIAKDPSNPLAKMAGGIIKEQSEASAKGLTRAEIFKDGIPPTTIDRVICIPKEVTSNTQLALIVTKYVRDHPEKLHEPRSTFAFAALQTAFPCPKEKPHAP